MFASSDSESKTKDPATCTISDSEILFYTKSKLIKCFFDHLMVTYLFITACNSVEKVKLKDEDEGEIKDEEKHD